MRTTLDIGDDILFAAKELAKREKKTLGQVITELARLAFAKPADLTTAANNPNANVPLAASQRLNAFGIHPLPKRGGVVSNEQIDRLRNIEGI